MKKYTKNKQESIRIQKEFLKAKEKNEKPIYNFAIWCVDFCKQRNLNDERILISTHRHIYNEAERLIKSLCVDVEE
jgi:hypothetical protein